MAAAWTWLTTNWVAILAVLVAVDSFLVGIFPNDPIFGTIGSWLAKAPSKL